MFLCRDCDEFRFPNNSLTSSSSSSSAQPPCPSRPAAASGSSTSMPPAPDQQSSNQLPCSSDSKPLIINELLYFVMNKFDTQPKSTMAAVISNFFREGEIFVAKVTLMKSCDSVQYPSLQPFMRKRIGENKIERSVDDILSAVSILDELGVLTHLPTFCAATPSRVPVIPDEMSDIAAVRHEVTALRKQVTLLTESMAAIRDGQ